VSDLPPGWTEVVLGDICEFRYGKSLPAAKRSGSGYPVFGSNGQVGAHSTTVTKAPAIVIGRKGSFGEVHWSDQPCWPIDTTYFVDAAATDADLRWLFHRLRCLGLTELNRAAAIPGLNREDAYRKKLLLPPLEEQRRIAAILDKADELRAKRLTSLEALRRLEESTFEEFMDSVADTTRAPLGSLVERVTVGHVGPTSEHFCEEGVPFLRTGNVGDGEIRWDDLRHVTFDFHKSLRKSELHAGDVVVSRVISDEVRAAVVPLELDGSNCANVVIVRPGELLTPHYLLGLIRHRTGQAALLRRRVGSAQSVVNTKVVQEWEIPVPSPAALERLESELSRLRSIVVAGRSSLSGLDELRATLQARAFSGDL